jgi:hypothetical protein
VTSAILLRIASVVAVLQCAAHTVLILFSSPKHGPEEVAVVEAMKAHKFDFLGSKRSYWDFYFGYALMAAVVCFVQAVLFWQLAEFADVSQPLVRAVTALFLVANVVHALLAWRYFFITPIVPDIVIVVCLALAFVRAAA